MTIKKVLSVTGIILVTVASLAACSSKSHTTKTGKKEVNLQLLEQRHLFLM